MTPVYRKLSTRLPKPLAMLVLVLIYAALLLMIFLLIGKYTDPIRYIDVV